MLPKKNMILGVAFAIPVLCSLIGAGAFVLLVTPVPVPGPDDPNEVETLQQKVNELRAELENSSRLLAQLELTQKVDALESSTANLLGKLSGVGEELAVIEAAIRNLDPSGDEEKTQHADQKLVRSVPADVPQFRLNRLTYTGAHTPHWSKRG